MTQELEFAVGLARQAGEIMRKNFSLGMKKEWKADDTPVTATDNEINTLVMRAIQEKYPTHSFVGEEGSRIIESEYTWVCDPVDGTVPFSQGWPTFAFSLALVKNGESVLGVIYDAMGDRLVTAEKGKGAYMNGAKVSVSQNADFDKKTLVDVSGTKDKLMSLREKLLLKGSRVPVLYSSVYAGMLVALGEFATTIHEHDKPWDAAAVKVIVEEAGGKVTDLAGNDQRYDGITNGFIASNGKIHEKLVELIRPMLSS